MSKLESFACFGLVAFISVGFIAGATAASSAINKVEQRLAYRNCLLSQTLEICAAVRPLGAKAALVYDARFAKHVETSHYKTCLTTEFKPMCDAMFPDAAALK